MNSYHVYIVTGTRKTRRESGIYTHQGKTYAEATADYVKLQNSSSFYPVSTEGWRRYSFSRKGLPKHHQYFRNNNGDRLLLVKVTY